MKPSALIKQFSIKIDLPIDVNEVVSALHQSAVQDDIAFIGVDLNPEILQGQIKLYHRRAGVYAEPKRCANIYYHRGHTVDWQRLICCKELIHILDPVSAQTQNGDQILQLAEKIGLPPGMADPETDGLATNVDRLAEFRATAILLPWDARQLLKPKIAEKALTIDDVARLADIPRKYVSFVMHDAWEHVHPLLIADGTD